MTEREIKGIITHWAKEVKCVTDTLFKLTVHLDTDTDTFGHGILGSTKSELDELLAANPAGTGVSFKQYQKGEYWNYKKDSWKQVDVEPTTHQATIPENVDTKSQSQIMEECLEDARTMINKIFDDIIPEVSKDVYFEMTNKKADTLFIQRNRG